MAYVCRLKMSPLICNSSMLYFSRYTVTLYFYRPQRSCEGYVFTPVCYSVHRGLPQCILGYHPTPQEGHPPGKHTPSGSTHTPRKHTHTPEAHTHPGSTHTPRKHTSPGSTPPPGDGCCCGRYASYWNAFLFMLRIYTICFYIMLFTLYF